MDDQYFVSLHSTRTVRFRHGDLESAFKMVDRMIEEGLIPDAETYSHMLQGCIRDKDSGFKLAIEVP